MHWALLVIIVIALLIASFKDLRFGLGALGALLLAVVIFYFASGATPWPGSATQISASSLEPSNVIAEQAYAGSYRVTSRFTNPSSEGHIKELALKVRTLDCPQESDEDSSCTVIADSTSRVTTDIPPGQTQDVVVVVSPPAFNIAGVARWRVTVEDVRTR